MPARCRQREGVLRMKDHSKPFQPQAARLIRGLWPIRKVMALLMRGVWAIDQRVAPWLDKSWKGEGETAGYFVLARKGQQYEPMKTN